MALPAELIEQIREASDIVALVQQEVPTLKKAGASWKGLCPFHNEKTPSFSVHPAKQFFHCYGCHEGGDVFAFVQKTQKISFIEAVRFLAERAGISLPEAGGEAQREAEEARRREMEQLGKVTDLAAAWFRRHLEESEEAASARAYAEKRGLDPETREKFQLGWAPADGSALLAAAKRKGVSEADLDKAGLLSRGEGNRAWSRFRARLIFPIHDPKGRLAGFGGRVLGEGEPKYLNSPEGPLFSKGRLLYPWSLAREAVAKGREALIVEGYLDAIACHQHGFSQAVATLGTSLTEDHARLLKRHVDRVILLFDADAAGLRAARRAGEPLLAAGLQVKVARLEGGKDPDEVLRALGPEPLRLALEQAKPLLGFCVAVGLEQARAAGGLTPQSRAAVLADLFPLIERIGSAVEAEAELAQAAQSVGVSPEAAAEDLAAWRRGQRRPVAAPVEAQASQPVRKPPEGLVLAERELLRLLVTKPDLLEAARQDLPEPSFCTPEGQAAAELLWKAPGGGVLNLPDDGSEAYRLGEALLRELSFESFSLPATARPDELLRDLLSTRQERLLERERAALKTELRQADAAAASGVLRKLQQVEQALQELKNGRRTRHLRREEESE